MPKQVDPHSRRTLLADALLRVAASRGLMDVSLRHVAAEAGVTAGMVQHYFRTKDEMMVFALDVVAARVQARLEEGPAPDGPRARVRALLVQLLPVDADRELEGRVAIAFHAYAATRPAVAARLREDARRMREAIAAEVAAAGAPGALDPQRAATGLVSLVEGLAIHVLGGHVDADHALATLEGHLDLAFALPRL
ncbi:TetR/AcrR family transcriptional regulator [Actinomycetospora cinnamomea]|uniref:TetR family transcriptional regulator n=1 Tax=Actinomycetospora cinnamomea TaxID=663609 RepID=A0A2U1F6X2_9PSEU|nr:TetR family transcriptional regulator C-terminal domain-containing protein [Actinomycetospora cinnamomea]PVZ07902.1 TetR family transcriptional regulator [Actinomycetospora cinnamomea]